MAGESQKAPIWPQKLMHRLAQRFVAGVLVILPVAITVGVIAWVADFLRRLVGPDTLVGDFLTRFGLRFVAGDALAYALGKKIIEAGRSIPKSVAADSSSDLKRWAAGG